MKGVALKGRLTYIDTKKDQIEITSQFNGEGMSLIIDSNTTLPRQLDWEDLLGKDIEAIVIDGKVKSICLQKIELTMRN